MSTKPLIAVVGATGAQGGSVVEFLLRSGKWSLRGLTRKVDSPAAQALVKRGVEMVACDVSNAAQLEKAFKGAYGVFSVTSFWETGAAVEVTQGKLIADIAKKSGVTHFIYSSLPNTSKLSGGKMHVPHLDSKAEVEDHARKLGFKYVSFAQPGMYLENFLTVSAPKDVNGVITFSNSMEPTGIAHTLSVADYGGTVKAMFENPEKYNGRAVGVASEGLTMPQFAQTFEKVTGKKAAFSPIPYEVAKGLGYPGAQEIAEMFLWFSKYGIFGPNVDPTEGKKIYPEMLTFEGWLKKTGWKGEPKK